MKILYITPSINNEGGVARVLSVKANYLVDNFGYQVHILTQNEGNYPLFFSFSDKIVLHDMVLKGNPFSFLIDYKKALKKYFHSINPDLIIVCDNGLKGYCAAWIASTPIPILFECHGSKYMEVNCHNLFDAIYHRIGLYIKNKAARSFDVFVVLSQDSSNEWAVKNTKIIPNPNWLILSKQSDVKQQKVITVARHTYEKGLDRLLLVWQKVTARHSDWTLDIYGKSNHEQTYSKLAKSLNIEHTVNFFEPVINIQDKYSEASIYAMTSRFEGFPMVLIEAMACGLPCVAFDCPVGPRAIINHNNNGFLVPENNNQGFCDQLSKLIEDKDLLHKMSINAYDTSLKFNLDEIMNQWNSLFKSLV
jgi:glycosyltransferase involved in cell wall biosynthesis